MPRSTGSLRARFGAGIGRHENSHEIAEHAAAAEACGFQHLTFVDDIQLTRDVYSMLTIGAINTSRILIGAGVTHTKTRHPVQTAVATSTIHELSNGRAFLGLGAGHLNAMLGLKPGTMSEIRDDRNLALDEGHVPDLPSCGWGPKHAASGRVS